MSAGQPVEIVGRWSVHGSDPGIGGGFRLADVFGKSFAIFGRHFVAFVVLALVALIPRFVTGFVVGAQPAWFVDWGLAMATQSFTDGVVTYGVVQELRGRTFSVADSIRVVVRRFLPLLSVTFGTTLVIGFGLMLLAVPGLVFWCIFFVALPVCVTERTGCLESMSRSGFLTRGYRWQVFGTLVLLIVVDVVCREPARLVLERVGPRGEDIGLEALRAVVGAFGGVVTGVFYYQLRVAKEGVDIERIASVFD